MVNFESVDIEKMSDGDYALFQNVQLTFQALQDIEMVKGRSEESNMMYFVFSYNLFLTKNFDLGIQMLDYVFPSYYDGQMEENLERSLDHWQKAEELKNQVDPKKVSERSHHLQHAEIAQVIFGMIQGLQFFEDFNGKKKFDKMCERLKGKSWSIKTMPEIKSIKPE